MPVTLTDATDRDLPQIRDLQIASWRQAYRGLLPDAFLGDEVARVLGERWAVLPGEDWFVLAAWHDGRIDGFVSVDRARDGGPYVDNLHVRQDARGGGLGWRLMVAAAARLLPDGHDRVWLTVMRENTAARSFYAGIGGVEGPGNTHLLYGQPVFSIPVVWTDLAALAHLGPRRSGAGTGTGAG